MTRGAAPVAWLGQFQDITERKRLEQRLRQLADEDALTELPNRRSFEAAVRLTLELSARHQIAGSLLMIDLDGFKQINDSHGHATGDAALAASVRGVRLGDGRPDIELAASVGVAEFGTYPTPTVAELFAEAVLDAQVEDGAIDRPAGSNPRRRGRRRD